MLKPNLVLSMLFGDCINFCTLIYRYLFFPCSVQPCPDVKYGKRIHVLPIDDTVEGLTGYGTIEMSF